jgi:hypothetical protein
MSQREKAGLSWPGFSVAACPGQRRGTRGLSAFRCPVSSAGRAHGFASEDDSRRFCAAILAENGSCFPVDQR